MTDLKDRIMGVIYGTAIGDALGWPVEFDSSVTPDNPRVSAQSVPEQYTDDTQMMRAVCEGLLACHEELDLAARAVAKEFVKWSKSPENNRAPGNACMTGCRNLEKGHNWRLSGTKSGGCGTAMRSMAYALFFPKDADRASAWAAQHAVMTHTHPMASAAAAAVAAGVQAAISGNGELSPRTAVMVAMLEAAGKYHEPTAQMLRDVVEHPGALPIGVLDRYRGWAGHEAVAASLFCFLKHPDDYEQAVLLAVNSPGDSDSLGAITGALVGACVGLSGIPERWAEQVEDSQGLYDLGERICKRLGVK